MNAPTAHFVGSLVIVDSRKNTTGLTRLGITVTRRFGKAHERNRFKRLVRESFRHCRLELPSDLDLNIKPREFVKKAKMQQVMAEMKRLFE